jgi:hypothetical protein
VLKRRNADYQVVTLVGFEIQNIDILDTGRGLVLVNDFMFRIKIMRQYVTDFEYTMVEPATFFTCAWAIGSSIILSFNHV